MTEPATLIKVWTLHFENGEQGYSTDNELAILEELKCLEPDAALTVSVRMMPQEEFDTMPEYQG